MRFKLALVSVALLTASAISRADTMNVFNLNGTTSSGVLSGTVTLDATTGKFTDASVNYLYSGVSLFGLVRGTTYNYTGSPVNTSTGPGYSSNDFAGTGVGSLFDFDLTLPLASLTGYTGGALCTTNQPCSGQASSIELLSTGLDLNRLTSGTLTLVPPTMAVTPEPSALLLLGTGVLGLGVLLRKRHV